MRLLYTSLALLLAICAIGTSAPPATNQAGIARQADDRPAPPAHDIVGYYTVQGHIAGADQPYTGVVSITRDGKAYIVRWLLDDGSMAAGVGMLYGDVLSVGSSGGQGRAICVRYDVRRDGGKVVLAGKWVGTPGNGLVHTETLTWLRGLVKAQGDI